MHLSLDRTNAARASRRRGGILVVTIVFVSVFLTTAVGFVNLVLIQQRAARVDLAKARAVHIAEAGIQHGRWRLAHDPDDYAQESVAYQDPEGGTVGNFTVEFTPPGTGSTIVNIRSTAYVNGYPDETRVIDARYGYPSFAQYSYLFDSNVNFGGGTRDGRIHANGGVQMNATATSLVTSAVSSYWYNGVLRPGVWGTGGNQYLWNFPVSNVNFDQVTVDLAALKDMATNQGVGLFLNNTGLGYVLEFQGNGPGDNDGTVDVYTVTSLRAPVWSWTSGFGWGQRSYDWATRAVHPSSPYTLQTNDLIFVENNVWVRGVVDGRVTVAAAFLDGSPNLANVYLDGNIVYENQQTNDALGLIAQKNVQFVLWNTPADMEVNGALFAQTGRVVRDYYSNAGWNNCQCGSARTPNSITFFSSIISKQIGGYLWGHLGAGFFTVNSAYDGKLIYNPPPHFPVTGDLQFISWEEKRVGEL